MELAVVGSEEFVLGFRLAGIKRVVPCTDEGLEEAVTSVLADKEVGILVLHDLALESLPQSMRTKLREGIKPVLITLGEEEEDLRRKVKRVIGIDLYVAE
ncbi:MAG: V-type ATP synthase subunit F [Candidatus Thermoplasmatota archaeon]